MTTIPKVTDLVQRSLDEHAKSQTAAAADRPGDARRHYDAARLYADLAEAQGVKTSNVIAYLNSDRERWSETDDAVVRSMLGLHPLNGEPEDEDEPDEFDQAPDGHLTPAGPAAVVDLDDDDLPDFGTSRTEVTNASR